MGVRIHREYPPSEGIYYDLFLVAFLAAEGSLEGHKNYHTWRFFQTVCLIWSLFFEVMFMSFFVVGPRVNMVAAAAAS